MHIHSINDGEYNLRQSLHGAHKLGCHHLAASEDGSRLASVGFGGEIKVWALKDGSFHEEAFDLSKWMKGVWCAIGLG